ncbi:MAG TPA: hypothetical protein V6C58_02055 [Allocoleopsis sp.]
MIASYFTKSDRTPFTKSDRPSFYKERSPLIFKERSRCSVANRVIKIQKVI